MVIIKTGDQHIITRSPGAPARKENFETILSSIFIYFCYSTYIFKELETLV